VVSRNRIPLECVGYALYLYFSGLSLRRASERLFCFVKRNHVSVWNWIQKHKPTMAFSRRKKISEFVIDETLIKVGQEPVWLRVAMEPKNKETLALTTFRERNMLVAERFISGLVKAHRKHAVSTDGGTWYPQVCRFLNRAPHPYPF
jgi:putative transposase